MGDERPLLVFLLTEDWFFASHFLERGIAAQRAGFRVALLAREGAASAAIRAAGIEVIPLDFQRRRLNPLAEAAFVLGLARRYRALGPAIVHHIALKPIVMGGLAARLARVRAVVNAPVGLGFVFSSRRRLAALLRPVVFQLLRATLGARNARVIFENPDDLKAMTGWGLVRPGQCALIRGAGVDLDAFAPAPSPPPGPVRVILIARMIREKGVGVFVDAARMIREKGIDARFTLVGSPDEGNPDSIGAAELRAWAAEGVVEWLGARRDVAALLAASHIACQPSSYGEGLPKSALEALAAGLPLVATDIPGCREAVADGVNGLLIPPRDPRALAAALIRLIGDPALRARMGAAGRARAEAEFGSALVCRQTLAIYRSLCEEARPVGEP